MKWKMSKEDLEFLKNNIPEAYKNLDSDDMTYRGFNLDHNLNEYDFWSKTTLWQNLFLHLNKIIDK